MLMGHGKRRNHTYMKGAIMNKKQLIAMWVGIILVAAYGLEKTLTLSLITAPRFYHFIVWMSSVVIVTIGLVVTLAEKKSKRDQVIRESPATVGAD